MQETKNSLMVDFVRGAFGILWMFSTAVYNMTYFFIHAAIQEVKFLLAEDWRKVWRESWASNKRELYDVGKMMLFIFSIPFLTMWIMGLMAWYWISNKFKK